MNLEMSLTPQMGMQVTPALLNLTHLLTLPIMELQQMMEQELNENPALEEIELAEMPCSRCGGPVVEGFCLRCALQPTDDDFSSAFISPGDELDQLLFVAAPRSLNESILEDLYASLPEHEHGVALALVGSLDEHGFLADEPADLAASLGVAPERVSAVLRHMQAIGPPGIGTRDTRTCMLAQLDALQEAGTTCPHARIIIDAYLEELGAHHYKEIARALGVPLAEVEAAQAFIRQHLWPYPAQSLNPAASESEPDRTRYRIPDLAITEHEGEFTVEVLQAPRRRLRMNPLYQELARNSTTLDEQERSHVQEYISRARVFLTNLRQRESTLQRVGEAIVARQEEALRYGVRHLVPMTRADIAAELGLHESTVSRTVADKNVLMPDRTLLPLRDFFVVSRGIKDVIRELIDNETTPLSDQDLVVLLYEQGYDVARRTVAKYRQQMKILPSHLR